MKMHGGGNQSVAQKIVLNFEKGEGPRDIRVFLCKILIALSIYPDGSSRKSA